MSQRNQVARRSRAPDSYLKLIRHFPLRPIRSDRELDQAISTINTLLDREKLDRGEQDYLDVLGDLVENYEEENYPIKPTSDAEMLSFLLDLKSMSQTQLANQTAIASSTTSDVLSGKRRLTRAHIQKLAAFFEVTPAVFMAEG